MIKNNQTNNYIEMSLFPEFNSDAILAVIRALIVGEFQNPDRLKGNPDIKKLLRCFKVFYLNDLYYRHTKVRGVRKSK